MIKLEIRCCCIPRKLQGWINVPEELVKAGGEVTLPLRKSISGKRFVSLQVAHIKREHYVTLEEQERLDPSILQGLEGSTEYVALKSEDVPIEVLRNIPGFIENGPFE